MKIVSTLGQGPVLNVLHGWGMNAHLFDEWSVQLSQHFQVNLIDLPGHGLNHEQAFPANLTEVAEVSKEIPSGIWLGWSLGGMLALNQALHYPEQVRALVMMCATPSFTAQKHWPHGTDVQVLQQFGKELQQDVKKTIHTFLALEVMGSPDERSQLRELKTKVFERPLPDVTALTHGLSLLEKTDLSSQLKNLQMPSLWLSGRRDRLVLPAAVEQAAKACGGEYHMVRGASHAPFIHHAEEITQTILDFL
ncbi:pimeloyl-ACP methyl ester esterase BioH [Marinicella rhabdoformis]|uniref:pimeloyl-ACP methyl ester esterase BioH n=1 Tax=Marinicella rhabdoformis TaxID=2580566 RepID=UPI0012AECB59|nr:pimeloyl-ACP methyl ester esterase BioH [Marinicella rhabdoformis]